MQQPEVKLYDLYDIWYQPLLSQGWFVAVLSFFGCVLVGLLIWIITKKIYKQKQILPWERALSALTTLQDQKYMNTQKSKEFYSQLSLILKEYLHERYTIALLDKTDQELLEFFRNDEVLKTFSAELEQVLQGATRVKFAQKLAALETMKQDLATCSSLVEKTRPTPPS